MGLLALLGILVFAGAFSVYMLSTIPIIGPLITPNPIIMWVLSSKEILYATATGLVIFSLTRHVVYTFLGVILMALILMLGILPI